MSERLPEVADLAVELRELTLATQPWELHGALAGWIAGGGEVNRRWLAEVLADASLADVTPGSALEALGKTTEAQMQDASLGFELLMPDEDAGLDLRSGALFDWCRHFLGAFGLAAGAAPNLSPDGIEALDDLAQLATATAEADGDEEDEAAFTEIEEFVRVAALLLHGDCAMAAQHRKRLH